MSWLLENADKVQTLLAIVGGVVLLPGVKPLIAWLVDDWQSDLKRKFDAWESADATARTFDAQGRKLDAPALENAARQMRRAALQPLIKRCEDLYWRGTSRFHALYPMPGVAGAFFTFGGVYALGTSKDSGADSVKMGVVLGTVGLFFLIAQGVWTVIKTRHIRNATASQIEALLEGFSLEQGAQERAATEAPPEATAPRG